MDWITENWDTLVAIVTAGLALASLITRLTPTPKDDEFVRRLVGFLSFLRPADSDEVFKAPFTKAK